MAMACPLRSAVVSKIAAAILSPVPGSLISPKTRALAPSFPASFRMASITPDASVMSTSPSAWRIATRVGSGNSSPGRET